MHGGMEEGRHECMEEWRKEGMKEWRKERMFSKGTGLFLRDRFLPLA